MKRYLIIGGLLGLCVIAALYFVTTRKGSYDGTLKNFLTYTNEGKADESYKMLSDRMKETISSSRWEEESSVVRGKYEMSSFTITKREKINNLGGAYTKGQQPTKVAASLNSGGKPYALQFVMVWNDKDKTWQVDELKSTRAETSP